MPKNKQDNPLPGFIDDEWDDHNYSVFRDHYVLMLRVAYTGIGEKISSAIEEDGTFAPHCDSRTFSLNELAFEVRAAYRKTTDQEERSIRDMWVRRVVKDHGSDAGLDFLIYLKASRKKRDEQFFQDDERGGYGYSD